MTRRRLAHLADRSVIELAGADVRSFLQGLISNDVAQLGPDAPLYAAMLTPQGKFLFDFILIDRGDVLWLDCAADTAAQLLQRLTMYRLRAAVTLGARDDLAVVAVWGGSPDAQAGWLAYADPRLPVLGHRLIGPVADLASLPLEAGLDDYEAHRIACGVPAAPVDLVAQKSILLECNFEELHGVSFTKGCFVGQELTARTKHRALIKKRLLPIRVEGGVPLPGTPVTAADKDAGEIRSGAGELGLALLRLERLAEPLLADGRAVELRALDWLAISQPQAPNS